MGEHRWKGRARNEFDDWAAEYDDSILQKYLFEPAHNALLEQVDANGIRDILDIGCGTGVFARRIVAAFEDATVEGLDLSQEMIRVAREKTTDCGRMKFTVGDSEHLPFDDGAFDCVTCSNSFHHYPHPKRVLAQFRRVLKPGGRALVVDGDRDDAYGLVVFQGIVRLYEGRSVHHHRRAEFQTLFSDAGFESVSFTKVPVRWPLPLPLVVAQGRAAK